MSGQHSVHVSSQAQICVNTSLVKLDLNKTVRVCANNKIYLSPVNHNDLFNVVNNIRELLFRYTLHASIHLSRLELPSENLILFNPLGSENILFAYFVGVI